MPHLEVPLNPALITDAELYALVHRGTPGDVEFYRSECNGVGSVLELGVGYGRVLSTLASELGRELYGLDLDTGLLALASTTFKALGESEETQLVEGDMRTFELGRRFDRILIPYNAIYCLPTEADVERCFVQVEKHLTKRGRLVLDAYNADQFAKRRYVGPRSFEPLVTAIERGRRIEISERTEWDAASQVVTVSYRYVFPDTGEERIQVVPHHARPVAVIQRLARSAGLEVFSVTAAFRDGTFKSTTERWVMRAHSAQPSRTTAPDSKERSPRATRS